MSTLVVGDKTARDVRDGEQLALFNLSSKPVGIRCVIAKARLQPRAARSCPPPIASYRLMLIRFHPGAAAKIRASLPRRGDDPHQTFLPQLAPGAAPEPAPPPPPAAPPGWTEEDFGLLLLRLARFTVKRRLIGPPPDGHDRESLAAEIAVRALPSARRWTPGGTLTLPRFAQTLCRQRLLTILLERGQRAVPMTFLARFPCTWEPDAADPVIRRPRWRAGPHDDGE